MNDELPPAWKLRLQALQQQGLNVWGVSSGAPFQEQLSGCQSAVVLASGGGRLWESWLEDLRGDPDQLLREQHPLDAYVRRLVEQVGPGPSDEERWIFCSAEESCFVDFRMLALEAGLGWDSRLGLLMHPHYGPWMGLRALCLTRERLPRTPRLHGGPCEDCSAPCARACPAAALQEQRLDIQRCSQYHIDSGPEGPCADRCGARLACPEGSQHRYPDLELSYHYDRASGREKLASSLRIPAGMAGLGPDWAAWTQALSQGEGKSTVSEG